ncbi:hypothetical protein ABEV34_02815 [Methylorubrum rhodesianum]|uniref:hypothetical protein n=1 Tax=Methylorubrum TaxID=2282523 RepID=UPI0017B08CE0|nr:MULTISPECIES: hypothetical protein [Methylorubrum]MBB5760652.1 hypothetical protein [Methylorubrum rhodesianum]
MLLISMSKLTARLNHITGITCRRTWRIQFLKTPSVVIVVRSTEMLIGVLKMDDIWTDQRAGLGSRWQT